MYFLLIANLGNKAWKIVLISKQSSCISFFLVLRMCAHKSWKAYRFEKQLD